MTGLPHDRPLRRRRTDRGWHVIIRENAYRDVWLLVVSVLVAVAVIGVENTQDDRDREAADRRDQTCLLFERSYHRSVQSLEQTYRFLERATPRQARDPIVAAILAQLPQTELRVRDERNPAYCDKPGVGLREPNPRVPKRPDLSHLKS